MNGATFDTLAARAAQPTLRAGTKAEMAGMTTERADNAKPGTRVIRWLVGGMIGCGVLMIACAWIVVVAVKATDTKTEPGDLRAGTQAESADLRPATKADIADLRADNAEREKRFILLFFFGMIALTGFSFLTAFLNGP